MQCHRSVQGSLATECWQNGVWFFFDDDRFDVFGRDRFDVGRVSKVRIGHNRRRVRIDQNYSHPVSFQNSAGLGARIVELRGLTDNNRSGPDDKDRVDVCSLGH